MAFLTDFADQAVILPLVVAISGALAWQGWWRGAMVWLLAIGVTFAAMLVLKLVFLGCPPIFSAWELRSPSGHVAAAAVVSGGLVVLWGWNRRAILGTVLAFAFGIGLTRVGLGAHSWPEVIMGASIGLMGALGLALLAGPLPVLRARPLILTGTLVVALLHGRHLEAETVIRAAASQAGWFPAWCAGY